MHNKYDLECPNCGRHMQFHTLSEVDDNNGVRILEGYYECQACSIQIGRGLSAELNKPDVRDLIHSRLIEAYESSKYSKSAARTTLSQMYWNYLNSN